MRRNRLNNYKFAILVVLLTGLLILIFTKTLTPELSFSERCVSESPITNQDIEHDRWIVPNILHLIHFGEPELSFIEVVAIKSAHINHNPDRIIIHCNCQNLSGNHWNLVKNIPGLEVVYKKQPVDIFGTKLSSVQHASDIARIEVLMEYGGIYIDSDVYVVGSLDVYLKFEFTIGWPLNEYLGTQVLVAHKNAKFLKLWYESYRDYRPHLWYYNAGELPTISILCRKPYLVNRVPELLGVSDLRNLLYDRLTNEWKNFKTIHLLFRLRRKQQGDIHHLDLEGIKKYNRTFGNMARLVLYGSEKMI